MLLDLPVPLGDYFAAANVHDADRVAACFAENAVVHDEGRDRQGRDSIRAWADETGRKYRHTAQVLAVETSPERAVVAARVAGEFPGSPIELRYRFALAGGKIVGLKIS
jgi:ketosteroid isomerase-like protein